MKTANTRSVQCENCGKTLPVEIPIGITGEFYCREKCRKEICDPPSTSAHVLTKQPQAAFRRAANREYRTDPEGGGVTAAKLSVTPSTRSAT